VGRRLFTLVSALSLVLLLATLGLWAIVCVRGRYFSWVRPWVRSDPLTMRQVRYNAGAGWDGVAVTKLVEVRHYDDAPTSAAVEQTLRASEPPEWNWYGSRQAVVMGQEFGPGGDLWRAVSVTALPRGAGAAVLLRFWFLALLFGICPTLWLQWRRRQQRLASAGSCLECGYDLRATPDRCPECGTVAAKSVPA
jgi:hypothetical protein